MKRVYDKTFPVNLISAGYKNNAGYVDDNIKRVKMLLEYYNICEAQGSLDVNRTAALEDYLLAGLYIDYRLGNTIDRSVIWGDILKNQFSLDDLEWTCLIMSLLFHTNPVYKRIMLKTGSGNDNSLDYETVLKVFHFTENISEIDDFYTKLINLKFKMSELCFKRNSTEIDGNIYDFFMCGEQRVSLSGVQVCLADKKGKALPIRERLAKKIHEISKIDEEGKQFCFFLLGKDGMGKKTIAKRSSNLMGKGIVIIDLNLYAVLNNQTFYELIYSPMRSALLTNSTLCLDHFEVFKDMTAQKYEYLDFLLENLPKFSREIFILSNDNSVKMKEKKRLSAINITLEDLSIKESYVMWKSYLDKSKEVTNVSAREMANKFRFTPGQIESTIKGAKSLWYKNGRKPLKGKDLCKCAYAQSISKLSDKAILIRPAYRWDDLILAESEKEMILSACDQIKYRHIVYDEWGMDSRIVYGKGLSMLFAGPPGTGKTMAAQVVANELGLELYKADLSQVVSKYIGETEKNLSDLFSEAKKSNVILFFDETDAILGKRTEVKDSHDKNANIETSYLLQQMEEYDGITIMTTNYLENIDQAFFRRISYVVHFAFPNAAARERIWRNIFPKKMPVNPDIDFKYLSENFEISGGSIKNIAINAAFMAARNSDNIKMEYVLKSITYELKKQGNTLIKDDLGEYAYLI